MATPKLALVSGHMESKGTKAQLIEMTGKARKKCACGSVAYVMYRQDQPLCHCCHMAELYSQRRLRRV